MTDEINLIHETTRSAINSLALLTLDTVTSTFENLETNSGALSKSLKQMVDLAKKVGRNTAKGELLPEINGAVRRLADAVTQLVKAFKDFMQEKQDRDKQQQFAAASEELGNAVAYVSDLIDETSRLRMIKLIKRSLLYMAEVEKQSKLVPEERTMHLTRLVQYAEDTNKRVLSVATNSQNNATNDTKKSLLNQALDKLEAASPRFIDMVRRIAANPNDQKNPEYRKQSLQYSMAISSGLNDILKSTQMEDLDLYVKLNEVLDYIALLIVPAKETQKTVKFFHDAVSDSASSEAEIDELHGICRELMESLIECARTMMQSEVDPTKRAFFEQAIWDLEDQLSALDAAASAALSRSADAVKRSKQMTDSVWNTANKLILGPSKAAAEESSVPIHVPAAALSDLSDNIPMNNITVPAELDLDINDDLF